ncbi:MAG: hypothetical protein ACLP4R_21290 [Solirubrobacteraceae bacterium]
MELTADRGLSLAVFTAEPGTRSQEALNLLASWTATADAATSDDGDRDRAGHSRTGRDGSP